jgi:pentatricopeptide repeat protein
MNRKGEELLMLFIKDAYEPLVGKDKRRLGILTMNYVTCNGVLCNLVNSGDWDKVLDYKEGEGWVDE